MSGFRYGTRDREIVSLSIEDERVAPRRKHKVGGFRSKNEHLRPVIEQKNEAEAALRSTACRLRELGEGTAIWNDVSQHNGDLRSTLEKVIARWRDLCMQLVRTTIVGHVNVLFAPVLAWILCAPKYLNGMMTLGEVVQVAAAFVMVQGALNWFVDNYHRLADWISSVNRVSVLLLALDQIDLHVTNLNSAIVNAAKRNRAARELPAAPSIVRPICTLPRPARRPHA